MFLNCQGLVIPKPCDKVRESLVVRPESTMEEFKPKPFKVYKEDPKYYVVPRYWSEFENASKLDIRPEPKPVSIEFKGRLNKELQQDVAVKKYFEETSSGGVMCLDVGFGKTVTALAIAAKLGLRTMIMVHKEFLMNQWIERIQQFCPGSTIGRVQQDTFEIDRDFVIGMLQTLSQRQFEPKAFGSVGLLIVDEAHHIGARVFSQAMFKLCPKWTLGLTATPDRKDGLGHILNWFLGPTFIEIHRESQKQVSFKPVWFTGPFPPVTMNRMGKLSMPEMVTDLTEIDERNELIIKLIRNLESTRQVLILSDRRSHCEYLSGVFGPKEAGLYMGGMPRDELDRVARDCRLIFGTFSQAHEGLDIPKLDTVILTTPHSDVRQAIGRILRETPGKIHAPLIIDIVDQWSVLIPMYYKRRSTYKAKGFTQIGDPQDSDEPLHGIRESKDLDCVF